MKKTFLVSTLLIGTLLVGGTAFARMGGHGGGYCDGPRKGHGAGMSEEMHEAHMEHRLEFMEIALDLSEDQREKLEEMAENHWEQRLHLFTHAFRAKAIEQAELKTEMHAGRDAMQENFMAVLNAEQQAKAEKLMALGMGGRHGMCGMGSKGQGMHGKGMGMHGGCENCPNYHERYED